MKIPRSPKKILSSPVAAVVQGIEAVKCQRSEEEVSKAHIFKCKIPVLSFQTSKVGR